MTHPCYILNIDCFSLWWSKKKCLCFWKKSNWPTQKNWNFQLPPILNFFSRKLVSRINWCEDQCCSTYTVVRLSDVSSKNAFLTAWWPNRLSHINALRISRPFWTFFFKPTTFFLLHPKKISQHFTLAKTELLYPKNAGA